jgi:hypothetical protein
MSLYSKETYTAMLDQMLTFELQGISSFASEVNIKNAMKKNLGTLIKKGILKRYSGLVLDEGLNVHVTILDVENGEFDIILIYGA